MVFEGCPMPDKCRGRSSDYNLFKKQSYHSEEFDHPILRMTYRRLELLLLHQRLHTLDQTKAIDSHRRKYSYFENMFLRLNMGWTNKDWCLFRKSNGNNEYRVDRLSKREINELVGVLVGGR